jgi:hypothetical protein
MIDDALLLPADEVDYGAMDDARLFVLATQREEPFIATNALGELARRDSPEGLRAARTIVVDESHDRHLRAYAVDVLMLQLPPDALALLRKLAASTIDPLIVGAIVEWAENDPEALRTPDGRQLVEVLVERMRTTTPDSFTDREAWDAFAARHDSQDGATR